MSNTFGRILRVHTYGESHGERIGAIIDGFPAGIKINFQKIFRQLERRKPGQSRLTTARKEGDQIEIHSGIKDSISLGTPIAFSIPNKDARKKDYSEISDKYRPGHADYTYQEKFGIRESAGGGRSSARETANWVAAGAIAFHLLESQGITINSYVNSVGHIRMPDSIEPNLNNIDNNIVRCPDESSSKEMIREIEKVKKDGDSIGGTIRCIIQNVPPGWGEPIFDKLHARLAHAMMSINAVKGFQYGSGFEASKLLGSEHNDPIDSMNGKAVFTKNNSGGILGGISTGQDIYFDIAFKPVATIVKDQKSIDDKGNQVKIKGRGRHDPCVVPRAVPIVDALSSLVLADFYLLSRLSKA